MGIFQRLKERIKDLGARVRFKMSSLRSRVSYTLVLLYLSLGHSPHHAATYSITYFDCSQIQHLCTYKLQDVCKPAPLTQPTNASQTYQLLQKGTVRKMSGHSCRVVSTKFTDYCGAYGHIKHVKMPEIAVSRTISPQTCNNMIVTGKFISDDGASHDVALQTENIIHTQELGSIELGDNSVTCRGMPLTVQGHVIQDITVTGQYTVTLIAQEFLVRGEQVEVVDGHITLPENICGMDKLGCTTHDTTYVWSKPHDLCEFESIRTIEVTEESGFLIDRHNKIVLKKGALTSAGPNCPAGMIQHTNLYNIYLAASNMRFPHVTDDADITTYVNGRDDYVLYQAENLVNKQKRLLQGTLCKNRMEERGQQIIRVKGNQFIKANGDSVEHFICVRRTGKIKGAPQHCYEEIPLDDDTFVKISNRLVTRHGSAIPCNSHYGLKVQTLEGVWIEISQTIRQIATPDTVPLLDPGYQHEDLSAGGIYTEDELKSWSDKIMYGDLHQAIIKSITLGVCNGQGTCPMSPELPAYNLDNLLNPAQILEGNINPIKHVKDFITDNAVWISIAVLLLEGFKFLIFMSTIMTTLLQEGVSGVLAVLYVLFCSPRITSERVVRKARRKRKAEDYPLYPIAEEPEKQESEM